MSMKTPIQKIAEYAAQSTYDYVLQSFDEVKIGDSPIEHLMFEAISSYSHYVQGGEWKLITLPRGTFPAQSLLKERDMLIGPGQSTLFIGWQVPIGDYKADFTASIWNSAKHRYDTLVIECDGHNFHERTKEQAAHDRARDRWMQSAGFPVFRFTGSEIYRDPMGCANQVIDMIWEFYSPREQS